jgi:hypothetical protein
LAYTIGQARKDKFNDKHISLNEYGYEAVELCAGAGVPAYFAGAGVPEPRHILPEPELENSGKNSGRQNYEKLFHISTNIWH